MAPKKKKVCECERVMCNFRRYQRCWSKLSCLSFLWLIRERKVDFHEKKKYFYDRVALSCFIALFSLGLKYLSIRPFKWNITAKKIKIKKITEPYSLSQHKSYTCWSHFVDFPIMKILQKELDLEKLTKPP